MTGGVDIQATPPLHSSRHSTIVQPQASKNVAIEGPFGEHESLPSRNTTRGFTGRTRKNLEPARASHCEREDFHVVTQLVNSFLGIVMLPSTRDHKHKALLITLNDLGKKDWPKWDIEEKDPEKTETLQRLLEKRRRARSF